MSTSGFLYRDILKHVLPTLLLFLLIFPIFYEGINYTVLSSFAVVISITLGELFNRLSTKLNKFIFSERAKEIGEVNTWMNKNWNYRKVFYYLDKDERDYLYLTGAYIEFFKNNILVFFVFGIVIIVTMLIDCSADLQLIFLHQTSLFSSIKVNSLILIFACVILIFSLQRVMVYEARYLLYPDGQYDYFAEKIQKREREILFRTIYGKVVASNGDGLVGIQIVLLQEGNEVDTTKSIVNGFWSFAIKDDYFNKKLELKATVNQKEVIQNILVENFNKPYITINV